MNEAETRAEHIDPALRTAGWGVVAGSRVRREFLISPGRIEGHGKRGKPLIADYVLEYRNTKLAVVEAKAWDLALTEGLGQAKQYAGKLAVRFAYSTNGQGIYGVDMVTGKEGDAPCYPSPEELWNLTFAEASVWRDRFAAIAFEDKGGYFQGRYYQELAVERALQAIANGKQRILLTLATGTGKTFIAFQIAWKLFHSRWNLTHEPTRRPRILFLADRNILADQAYNAFSAFEEKSPGSCVRISPDEIRRTGKPPKNGSIFFTIFQTFMTGPAKDDKPSPYFGCDQGRRGGFSLDKDCLSRLNLLFCGGGGGKVRTLSSKVAYKTIHYGWASQIALYLRRAKSHRRPSPSFQHGRSGGHLAQAHDSRVDLLFKGEHG